MFYLSDMELWVTKQLSQQLWADTEKESGLLPPAPVVQAQHVALEQDASQRCNLRSTPRRAGMHAPGPPCSAPEASLAAASVLSP